MAIGSIIQIRSGVLDQRGRQEFGSGDGPGGGGVEARIAKLESDVQHIAADIGEIKLDLRALRGENRSDIAGLRADFGTDIAGLSADVRTDLGALQIGVSGEIAALRAEARTDFRLMFGALIAVTVTLAGLMAKGFGWLD